MRSEWEWLWSMESSGAQGPRTAFRTRHLRRDPRCTLFLWEGYSYLGLETTATILEGPDAADLSVRLFKVMQGIDPSDRGRKISWFGQQLDEKAVREQMVKERRLIYEFEIKRAYGL